MKVLVVLVFAVFTGYDANLVSADASTPKLDELSEILQGCGQTVWERADSVLQSFLETETGDGQTVRTHFSEGLKTAHTYTNNAWEGTPEWAKSAIDNAATSVHSISRLTEEKLVPVLKSVERELPQRAEEVLELAAPYTDTLKETLKLCGTRV